MVEKEDGDVSQIPKQWTKLTDYLIKNAKQAKAEVVAEGSGKSAEKPVKATLFYRKLCEGAQGTALVEVELVTGRFHQIRVQMAHAKMPLLGDAKYGNGADQSVKSVALCAYKLQFLHPKTKKKMEFEIKPRKAIFDRYEM